MRAILHLKELVKFIMIMIALSARSDGYPSSVMNIGKEKSILETRIIPIKTDSLSQQKINVQINVFNPYTSPITTNLSGILKVQVIENGSTLKPIDNYISSYPWIGNKGDMVIPPKTGFFVNYEMAISTKGNHYLLAIYPPQGGQTLFTITDLNQSYLVFKVDLRNANNIERELTSDSIPLTVFMRLQGMSGRHR